MLQHSYLKNFFQTERVMSLSQKIKNIRANICYIKSSSNLTKSTSTCTFMPKFTATDCRSLKQIVLHLNPSNCCLDTLPTSFFKSIFSSITPEFLQTVNGSLTFPCVTKKLQLSNSSWKREIWLLSTT